MAKTQFSIEFQQKIKVIFDGIDESFTFTSKINREQEDNNRRETKEKELL